MRMLIPAFLMWVAQSVPAFGQELVVQQPVVGTILLSTTVAVPDRGRFFLGGVSSAQSGRSRFGFGQPGSSLGWSRSSSSMSVGVTVIDLHEMDEAILSSASNQPEPGSRYSRHAAAINGSRSESPREPTRDVESLAERAAKFERLACKAEAEKHSGVAKLHWQMAAKYGSATAREKLR